MIERPIGITFMPSAENAAEGPRRGQLEGNLGEALKILSLRLPRVLGAKAIVPSALATPRLPLSPGFNPMAAAFQAMLGHLGGASGEIEAAPPGPKPGPKVKFQPYDGRYVPEPPPPPARPRRSELPRGPRTRLPN
jgi:hypothetical protein